MIDKSLKVAVVDMYDGTPNLGMNCIINLIQDWASQNELLVSLSIFCVRKENKIPSSDFDIFISSGGPGSPNESIETSWDIEYTHWLDEMILLKKPVLLICHSFQVACRHFNLGEINLRKSMQLGVLPIHPLLEDPLFENLSNPFYSLESRYYQIVKPNDAQIKKMGATIIALEKIRPQVPLERAIMGIKFNEVMYGVQFHPEGEKEVLIHHFSDIKLKESMIESFGIEKWENLLQSLKDETKIATTHRHLIPNFLDIAFTHAKK